MSNGSTWRCENCGESFCNDCDKKNMTDDFADLCDDCYNNLDEEPSYKTENIKEGGK